MRILPGESVGDSVGFSGAPKGRFAHAEFYARGANRAYEFVADTALQNPVSPTGISLVTNSGFLVTFDNWHNLGYGKAVAIYGPNGRLIQAYSLEQLYAPDRLSKIPRSVSSRWWRCAPQGYVDPDKQTEIYVFEHFGGTFTFKVESGAFAYHPGQAKCTPPERALLRFMVRPIVTAVVCGLLLTAAGLIHRDFIHCSKLESDASNPGVELFRSARLPKRLVDERQWYLRPVAGRSWKDLYGTRFSTLPRSGLCSRVLQPGSSRVSCVRVAFRHSSSGPACSWCG